MKWPLLYNLGRAQREKRGQELTRIARTFFNMYCFCICNYFFVFVFVKWPLLYNLGRAQREKRGHGQELTQIARTFLIMNCFCICIYFFVFVKWPLLYNLGRANRLGERMTKVEAGKGIAAS